VLGEGHNDVEHIGAIMVEHLFDRFLEFAHFDDASSGHSVTVRNLKKNLKKGQI